MAFQNQSINTRSSGNCPACGRTDSRYSSNAVQRNRTGTPGNRMSGNNIARSNMVRGNINRNNITYSDNTGNSCSGACTTAPQSTEHQEKDVFAGIDKAPLTMAYVPFQGNCNELYDAETALHRGTIFPELDKPFTGGNCHEKR